MIRAHADQKLFHMEEFSPNIAKKIAKLRKALEVRKLAAMIFPYIMTCRSAKEEEKRHVHWFPVFFSFIV